MTAAPDFFRDDDLVDDPYPYFELRGHSQPVPGRP